VRANRSAIGAKVRLTSGGFVQSGEVRSGGSYLSQGDLRVHFGLGGSTRIDRIEIEWPGGVRQVEMPTGVDRVLTVRERVP
jgi:hypothetical protein